jgi:hypothetical protein
MLFIFFFSGAKFMPECLWQTAKVAGIKGQQQHFIG